MIQTIKNQPVEMQVMSLFLGHIKAETTEVQAPVLMYRGRPLPLALWRQILAFFKWSWDTHHSESQVRLFYHEGNGQWQLQVHPQYISGGLATDERRLTEDEQQTLVVPLLIQGYSPMGTVHHHGNATAFQSGGDRANEERQNGVHLTVGNLDGNRLSLHGRVVFRGIQYEMNDESLKQWLESPILCCVPDFSSTFDESWKTRMLERPKPVVVTPHFRPITSAKEWEEWKREHWIDHDDGWVSDGGYGTAQAPQAPSLPAPPAPIPGTTDDEADVCPGETQATLQDPLYDELLMYLSELWTDHSLDWTTDEVWDTLLERISITIQYWSSALDQFSLAALPPNLLDVTNPLEDYLLELEAFQKFLRQLSTSEKQRLRQFLVD